MFQLDDQFKLPLFLLENLDYGYTVLLLIVRFSALFIFLPGIGGGIPGIAVRAPGMLVLALCSVNAQELAELPSNEMVVVVDFASELILGGLVGLFPAIVMAGVEHSGQLAATTMGLGAGALFDPVTQTQSTPLSKIVRDLAILSFLLSDSYQMVFLALARDTLGAPGSFLEAMSTVEGVISHSTMVFELGFVLAAPIVVALLLTNLTLGLITRTVSQVNIFIISFPLTILVGLSLSIICLPSVIGASQRAIALAFERLGALLF